MRARDPLTGVLVLGPSSARCICFPGRGENQLCDSTPIQPRAVSIRLDLADRPYVGVGVAILSKVLNTTATQIKASDMSAENSGHPASRSCPVPFRPDTVKAALTSSAVAGRFPIIHNAWTGGSTAVVNARGHQEDVELGLGRQTPIPGRGTVGELTGAIRQTGDSGSGLDPRNGYAVQVDSVGIGQPDHSCIRVGHRPRFRSRRSVQRRKLSTPDRSSTA